ncbi:ATP-binding cassette domain-containing protein [Actinospica durhamensis]|uniref:ATP-binding cassette domain-containing protein n=1 Tax=Actinospica durhamensis TaxID=1508375 RepID=A0A941EUA2_9ACTN|nr:ATP-binding cassette domain-containing protein [Actinospica durhamensis]MBR7837141.1 ATP-binding cassette domain-containing protein [Actinospica durhamensis]
MPTQSIGPVVSRRGLTRAHGSGEAEVRARVGVSLEVAARNLVAAMGPPGSGKSTQLALCGGLDRPTSGNVVVEGVHLSESSRRALARLRRTSVGYVFQNCNLIPALTAAENVAQPPELDGMRAGRARRLAKASLAEVGLDGLGRRFPEKHRRIRCLPGALHCPRLNLGVMAAATPVLTALGAILLSRSADATGRRTS